MALTPDPCPAHDVGTEVEHICKPWWAAHRDGNVAECGGEWTRHWSEPMGCYLNHHHRADVRFEYKDNTSQNLGFDAGGLIVGTQEEEDQAARLGEHVKHATFEDGNGNATDRDTIGPTRRLASGMSLILMTSIGTIASRIKSSITPQLKPAKMTILTGAELVMSSAAGVDFVSQKTPNTETRPFYLGNRQCGNRLMVLGKPLQCQRNWCSLARIPRWVASTASPHQGSRTIVPHIELAGRKALAANSPAMYRTVNNYVGAVLPGRTHRSAPSELALQTLVAGAVQHVPGRQP
ncbi:hypothetical protein LTR17_009225 [Elasticomyces elasticus]|nr:hypothetical protein LTR17_009225 [Elasticomyces elasticus]